MCSISHWQTKRKHPQHPNPNYYKLHTLSNKRMAEQQNPPDQTQFILSDFHTRLRDIDERNRLIRERVLLLGKNLISSRNEIEEDLKELKKENHDLKKEVEELKSTSNNLLHEFGKFIKKDEMILMERMLKDFQPLEFMRKKDVEELIQEHTAKKEIKTNKTSE